MKSDNMNRILKNVVIIFITIISVCGLIFIYTKWKYNKYGW